MLNNLTTLITTQKQIIDDAKLTDQKLEAANNRIQLLQSAVSFMYKIYDEGLAALNINAQIYPVLIKLQAENDMLQAENEKLKKVIEQEWN
jgi:hypothetical protein